MVYQQILTESLAPQLVLGAAVPVPVVHVAVFAFDVGGKVARLVEVDLELM